MLLGFFVALVQEIENAQVVAVRDLVGFRESVQWRKICCILDASYDILTQAKGFELYKVVSFRIAARSQKISTLK
jgi:hypothetical protein